MMSKTFLREGCSVEVEVGRKCLTTERPSPDGALGRVPCGGSHSWSVEGARTQLHNDGGAMWERGTWLWRERRNQMGKGTLGVGDRSHSMLTD